MLTSHLFIKIKSKMKGFCSNNSELCYTKTEINRNFKIKIHGVNYCGRNKNVLVGVSGLVQLIGPELANTLLAKAFKSDKDKVVCRLRRGLKITFYTY